jgi:hypothetical protein
MPRLFQRILASLVTLLVAAHAHAFEAGWMQIQTAGLTPDAPKTTVALYYPTMAAPRVVAMGPMDRGRERRSPSPPSEPAVQFSRDGLSSQLFPHRDWRAN